MAFLFTRGLQMSLAAYLPRISPRSRVRHNPAGQRNANATPSTQRMASTLHRASRKAVPHEMTGGP